jgi:DNA polymerase III alpha subunit
MRGHKITKEENMLKWLRVDRKGKLTSFTTICKHFWFMSKTKDVLYSLIDAGFVRKLKTGYRANKEQT